MTIVRALAIAALWCSSLGCGPTGGGGGGSRSCKAKAGIWTSEMTVRSGSSAGCPAFPKSSAEKPSSSDPTCNETCSCIVEKATPPDCEGTITNSCSDGSKLTCKVVLDSDTSASGTCELQGADPSLQCTYDVFQESTKDSPFPRQQRGNGG